MAASSETETVNLRPMGQGETEIVEVLETEAIGAEGSGEFESDGRRSRLRYKPRTANEAGLLLRGGDDLGHRKLITWAGLILIFIVALTASASFLGMTFSTAPNAHEDAVRLLILIIGAVLGTVFGAVVVANKDGT